MSEKILSNEEFLLIARDLEIYHAVFAKIWNIGKPRFSDKIPTACVTFDKQGNHLDFQFNPQFWDKCSPYERNFIICHECLHIMLGHGIRLKNLNRELGNVAADIVINEMLASGFGFDRSQLNWVDKNGCWLNTVFKDNSVVVEKDRSMEYYYNLLKKNLLDKIKEALKNGSLVIIDDHDGFGDIDESDVGDLIKDILDSINTSEAESLDKSFKESNPSETDESSKTAGTMPGNIAITIKIGNVKKKKKWETVIKRWANRFIKDADKDHEQWARINRRFVGLSNDLFLPSEMEVEEREDVKKRIKVVFFQDTSGSCAHLAERFFRAAKSLPKEKFDVKLYCFDTTCYETSIESGKLYGFGGTSFSILEQEVIKMCKGDMNKYPKAVFVITDGAGSAIQPAKPKNWYWFLSENYTHFIPEQCNKYKLSDFE